MTGRAAGYCAGFGLPGYANAFAGRGFGRGMGRGFGRGAGFGRRAGFGMGFGGAFGYAPAPYPAAVPSAPEQEMQVLKTQAHNLEAALGNIQKRIEEIESQPEEK
jgi:hypothetical protein